MAEKKVMMWAKKGGIMRDKMADNMIIMLAKVGVIMRDMMEDKKFVVRANMGGMRLTPEVTLRYR